MTADLKVVDRRGVDKPAPPLSIKERVANGKWQPHGVRLLVRALLRTDGSTITQDIEYDPRDADAWEVIAVGSGCGKWYDDNKVPPEERVKKGDHIMHRSVVADRADINDMKCRYWWLHVEDVLGFDGDPSA